eukprot:TRINITY_DN8595_c0_g1_i1.p1 TRINITY_DN8595_c0_g1~~TRINITY_DN8595_c0_g1_i1.p1  ORF type:complete len:171 (-),score=22.17 TRINITY_DN8595_c0_g1_i1:20-532(-)
MMKLIICSLAIAFVAALAIAGDTKLTMTTYSDSACTQIVSYSTNNIFSCQGLPLNKCQPASGGLYAMATCGSQWPKPTTSGSIAGIFSSNNCTNEPNSITFWAQGACIGEGSSSMRRTCSKDLNTLTVTYCVDSQCSQDCNTQLWNLTATSHSHCINAGSDGVLFQCYGF